METNKRNTLLLWLCLCVGIVDYQAQTLETKLIKFVNVSYQGVTDTVDLMPIVVNSNGNVIVSGNQKISATQYDAVTSEQLGNGISNWVNSFNPSGQKAFITASCTDASGFIYNVGAIRTQSSNGLDFLILKLSASGNVMWSATYDNGLNDGATAVCVDNSGNIYVTGGSEGIGLVDYATVAFNSSGSQVWAKRYNFNNNFDLPTAIEYDAAANQVFVTGSSGTTFNDWDFATVSYDITNGTQVHDVRVANTAGAAQDKVFGMATNSQGHMYITGTTYNGSNYDLQLIKLDTALSVLDTIVFDGHGFDDTGINLVVDGNDNVIVVGTSYVNPAATEILVLKYDKYGNQKWKFQRQAPNGTNAEGLRIKLKSDNEIFIGGNYGSGISQDIALLCLDSIGDLKIEKPYDDKGFRDRLMDLTIDGNDIYISGRSMSSAVSPTENNLLLQYKVLNISQNIVTNGTGPNTKRHVDQEFIISFNKKALKMSAINNKEFTFGALTDFVADSTCDKIEWALDPDHIRGLEAKNLETRKIFFEMTEADSLSESRTGNYVKVPEFYCSLVVKVPGYINVTNKIAPLNNIDPDLNYAQLNNVYVLASPPNTNDPEFSSAQGALHAIPGYSLGHINVDSAWAISTGDPSVRIGLLDSGVEQKLQDLPASIGGYDFCANTGLANGDIDDHGTRVAGTIGGIRNNNLGIAGVAGGDASGNKAGATMYDMKVTHNGFVNDAWASAGLYKSSAGSNIGGFAQHIATHGYYWAVSYDIKIFGHGVNQLIIDQLNFANRNGVAVVYPKANFKNIGTNVFPADWSDEIIMSVGSNGFDGEHCSPQDGNCSNGSTTWGQIDFLAPGTYELVKTISKSGLYVVEDGTSFAAPHVAGTAALMMSYRNHPAPSWDNMVHEDIEHLLQRTCTDLINPVYDETAGYDTVSGWGRINAYKAIQGVNKNFYRIRHITESIGNTGTGGAMISPVFTGTMTWVNYPGVPTGNYVTEIYKRTTVIFYNLLPSEKIIDKWPLYKECYGSKFDSTYLDGDRPYYGRIDSLSTTACTMSTYYYKIPSLNVHMPYAPGLIKSAFTVYTYDSTGAVGISKYDEFDNYRNFKVFPNPHKSGFDVEFGSDYTDRLTYKVTNILGQVILTGDHRATLGVNRMKINSAGLINGVYILSIFKDNTELYKQKIIKQD